MRTFLNGVCRRFWSFGIALGSVVSLLVTAFVTAWEWIENPGGIFRDEAGTNWQFVYDTAISWLLPTFLYVAMASAIVHLMVSGIRRFFRGRSRDS
ncbi:MAG: hypothetical protein ACR2QU_11395 [Gammaproteobacteria bacterium]